MKKKIFLVLMVQLTVSLGVALGQQIVTFQPPADPQKPGFNPNRPAKIDDFVAGATNVKLILRDNNKLDKVEFKDGAQSTKVTLANAELLGMVTDGTVIIHIKDDGSIQGIGTDRKVTFPFNIFVRYNNTDYLASGSMAGPPKPPGQQQQTSANPTKLTDGSTNTGVAYYDALAINTFLTTKQYQKLFDYMHQFYFTGSEIKTKNDLLTAVGKNQFLLDVFSTIPDGTGIASNTSGTLPLSAAAIGGLDVTNLADGLAKFLVKRSKEELSVAFFNRFKEFISKYPDAQLLFPQTYSTLQAIGDEIYNYKAYLGALRESFEKDINGLTANLPNVINQGTYQKFFNKHGDLKDICLSSIYIGNSLVNKEQPGQIIAEFDANTLLADTRNKDVKAAVQTLQIFSGSVHSIGTDHYWLNVDSLNLLIKDSNAFKLYLGLIYIKAAQANVVFNAGTLTSIFEQTDVPVSVYETYVRGLIKQATVVTANIKTLSGQDKDKLNFNDYYNFYNSALDMVQYAQQASQLPGLSALKTSDNFNNFIKIARVGGNIAFDINRKNYSSAIMNIYTEYNYVFGDNNQLNAIIEAQPLTAEGIAAKALLADKVADLGGKTDEFKSKFIKYGAFVAAVSQAQNSDDVESAIEAIALPSGSSSIKRQTIFNVALNAYVGPYFGVEKIKSFDARYTQTAGLAAPVGVSVSFGNAPFLIFGGHGTSYSLFVSVIDIGALASYRLTGSGKKDTTTSQIPTIQLKNIISPGAFLSIGIPKTPLSLSGGFQIGPNLRDVSSSSGTVVNTYADKLYMRWSVGLLVDIPLLNLYTHGK